MIRWLFYLLALVVMTIVAWIVTPILPAFAKPRLGPIDNNHGQAVEPRLPLWLAWFDTPDNSLLGEFTFSGLRLGPAGRVRVEVVFDLSIDGILSLHAKDLDTGAVMKQTVSLGRG